MPIRGILITFRDKVPALAAGEFSKEPTGVVRTHDFGMLGKTEERQPLAVALADESLGVGLLEEGEESCSVCEVFGHDVTQVWRLDGGWRAVFLDLFLHTRRGSGGGGGSVQVRGG